MIVLSLFDGISCGRVALERAGLPVTEYYSSEIDKNAIAISNHNYPDIIRLGDVQNWNSWNIPKPDIILAGSPCTTFSTAGSHSGFQGVSGDMYHHFLDILRHYKPQYFLLENVKMKQSWSNTITVDLNVAPVLINSSLVSAQNRERNYWTNIGGTHISKIQQPTDRQLYVKDILEPNAAKSLSIDTSKLTFTYSANRSKKILGKQVIDKPYLLSNINKGGQGYRVYSVNGKSVTLSSHTGGLGRGTGLYFTGLTSGMKPEIRRLSITECERLQTLPPGYLSVKGVSDRQKYQALGNGWTVDIISHILAYI